MIENNSNPKTAYSCYFEIQLNVSDYGKSRPDHNEICNRALLKHIEQMETNGDGIQISPSMSNEALSCKIQSAMKFSPKDFVWEHCSSSTANGRKGVMRLVPSSQHNPSSDFWGIFHRDFKNRGGYYEWAVPAGAPLQLIKSNKIGLESVQYQNIPYLTKEQVSNYLKHAVLTNNTDGFQQILQRTGEICTPKEVQEILSGNITIGHFSKQTTLLHLAAENGNLAIINSLIAKLNARTHLSHILNHELDTPAHIAAKHSRANVLKKLILSGFDLKIKNKKNETVQDILIERKSPACLAIIQTMHPRIIQNHNDPKNDEGSTRDQKSNKPYKDPAFTYSEASSATSKAQIGHLSYTFKDVLKSNFGEKKANHFIKIPEAPVKATHSFTDVIRKQFGERATHFTKYGERRTSQIYSTNATFWNEKNKQQLTLFKTQQKTQMLIQQRSGQSIQQRLNQPVQQAIAKLGRNQSAKPVSERTQKPIPQQTMKPNPQQSLKPVQVQSGKPDQVQTVKPVQQYGKSTPTSLRVQSQSVKHVYAPSTQPAQQRSVQGPKTQQNRPQNTQIYKQRSITRPEAPKQNLQRAQQARTIKQDQQRIQQQAKLQPMKPIPPRPQQPVQSRAQQPVQSRTQQPVQSRAQQPVQSRAQQQANLQQAKQQQSQQVKQHVQQQARQVQQQAQQQARQAQQQAQQQARRVQQQARQAEQARQQAQAQQARQAQVLQAQQARQQAQAAQARQQTPSAQTRQQVQGGQPRPQQARPIPQQPARSGMR